MQSYPLGKSNFATFVTSASLAARASFLSASVNTASIALNFTGPQGPSGSSYVKIGSEGPRGQTGNTGPQGLGVYLLTSSRAKCCRDWIPVVEWRGSNTPTTNCSGDYNVSLGALYTTCSGEPTTGCKVYYNNIEGGQYEIGDCSFSVIYAGITDGQSYWTLDSGVITSKGNCSNEF